MPHSKQTEPETYSSALKNIRDLSGKKKASALLPVMRTMTKYLHKGDAEMRIGKDDNKVTNLIHLFCSHLASACSPEDDAVRFECCIVTCVEVCRSSEGRS